MVQAKKKEKAKPFELCCPKCGNDGRSSDREKRIEHIEWMPVFRNVEGVEGKALYLDYDNYQDLPEEAKDPHFYCLACEHEWPIPDGLIMNSVADYEGTPFSEIEDDDEKDEEEA